MDQSDTTTTDSTESLREELRAVASNLAYGWHAEARELFERIDLDAFERAGRNPIAFLADLPDETLAAAGPQLAEDAARVRRVLAAEAAPLPAQDGLCVAYFCAEFGVDESLPIYSGGLGVLAGDHLKSASQLGLPLVAVGLLYGHGYFRQSLDAEGRQLESYPENDPARLPLSLERAADGGPLDVTVELADETVRARVWRADVGRVRLYLLDTDLEQNSEAARAVTGALYGGDRDLRIRQEVVLGVGGVRALAALGIAPTVFHLNEGHSAFLVLERIRELVARGTALEDAFELVRRSSVFTTHTPVPAGNEVFDPDLVYRYAAPLATASGLDWDALRGLGHAALHGDLFGLTPLALRTSARANGVSVLHAEVSRRMWRDLWPERRVDDVPIGHVTNGVHAPTWLAPQLVELLRAHGVRPEAPPAEERWENARLVPPDELRRVHADRKRALVGFLDRRRRHPESSLDPDALTIGFARRFATYKRADLLLSDRERLARLLGSDERPFQLLVAGKAHPADQAGKDLIHRVVELARDPIARGRIVFVEDYDLALARFLVQGVDVWLNTPRRPLEASGTSGMKAGMNGALNLSILDGWWAEGYDPEAGWAIGGETESDDASDAAALYGLLENDVLPLYYEQQERWLEMMRAAIAHVGGRFTTHRMVTEYANRFYQPAHRAVTALAAELDRAA